MNIMRGEKVERLFKCARCYVRFMVNVEPKDLQYVKCPRSCPVQVYDITEEVADTYQRLKEEHTGRVEDREKTYAEVAAKAQADALLLSKKRGNR